MNLNNTILFCVLLGLLLLPVFTEAGTMDLGIKEVHQVERDISYHLALSHKAGALTMDAAHNYGRIGDKTSLNDALLRLGYDTELSAKWSLWFDASMGYDYPVGIERESIIGAGPKYTIYKTDKAKASVSAGIVSHTQELKGSNGGVTKVTRRWSLRGKYRRQWEHSKTSLVVFYQPAVDNERDYLATGEAAYVMDISEALAIKLSVLALRRSIVPDGVPRDKLIQTLSLVLKWGE